MRAVVLYEFGGPEVLDVIELPKPTPRADQVTVRVAAATVNPTDILFRSGAQADRMRELHPPFVPGMEFAGVVTEGAKVPTENTLRIGQRVMGIVDPRTESGGAQAEFVTIATSSLATVPDSVDLAAAATLPMNGLTAKMAVEAVEANPGDAVLVTGASGAVGGYAVQLLRDRGVAVYADVKEDDRDLVQRLGATELIERGDGMCTELLSRLPDGVQGIIDAARLGARLRPVLRNGGTIVSLRTTGAFDSDPSIRHRYVWVTDQLGDSHALAQLASMTRDGVLTPRVAAVLPMTEVQHAHVLVEKGGLRGRVVLRLTEDPPVATP